MDVEQVPTEWLRALLPLAVLAVVAEDETYGYAVAQRLREAGLGVIKGGTLYPVLNRLEADALLTSSWREGIGGPGRKFFTITERGRQHLEHSATAWPSFTERAARLLPTTRSSR